jgi:hypothetical protein
MTLFTILGKSRCSHCDLLSYQDYDVISFDFLSCDILSVYPTDNICDSIRYIRIVYVWLDSIAGARA